MLEPEAVRDAMRNTQPQEDETTHCGPKVNRTVLTMWFPNAHVSSQRASLFDFDDNDAVIKIIKGRSESMRHISRTHSVNLEWLFDG